MSEPKVTFFREYFIYFSVFAASMFAFASGVTSSWAATIAPHLESNDTSINPLPEPPTTLESSWIVASVTFGSIVGPLIGGILTVNFGKKKTILFLGIPVFVSHLIIAFAHRVWMFIIARFIMGITLGCSFGVLSNYIGDIAEDRNRGLLVSTTIVFISTGGLSVNVMGPFVSIKLFSLLNLIPLILLFTLFGIFAPETPYDLVKSNSMKAAKRSLSLYRGKNLSEIDVEFIKLLENVNKKYGSENKNAIKTLDQLKIIWKARSLLRGVKIVGAVLMLQGLSGMGAVSSYYQTIFEESRGALKPIYSVMIIGIVTLFSTILTSQLVERLGRKILLLTGFILMGLALFSLGTYFLLSSKGHNTDSISWLPLASLMVFTIAFNIQGSIPWVLLTDIFPPKVLDICTTMASVEMFSLGFLLTLAFPYFKQVMGNYGAFYMFGGCMACAVVFSYFFVPETEGRSVEEVQKLLSQE